MKVELFIFAFTLHSWAAHASVSSSKDRRIVGGHPVEIERHPHQVSVRFKGTSICGGSINSERVVITAGHCIITRNPEDYTIIAGTKKRNGHGGYHAAVETVIRHEDYKAYNFDNDIAILVTEVPLPLNGKNIAAIELADRDLHKGEIATVTGWGNTNQDGSEPAVLQEVEVPIISERECKIDYGESRVTKSMFCAGYRGKGGKDACQGDSGGPLVAEGKLSGIVSWGEGCAQPHHPGVYTRINYFRSWIEKQVSKIYEDQSLFKKVIVNIWSTIRNIFAPTPLQRQAEENGNTNNSFTIKAV